MGWRDRDYAKFRKDELDALLGSSSGGGRYGTGTRRGAVPGNIGPLPRTRRRRRRGSGLVRALMLLVVAVVATAALLAIGIATGQVKDNSTLSGYSAGTPAPASPAIVPQVQMPLHIGGVLPHRTTRIAGTRLLQYGGTLTLSGSHTPTAGSIVISGRWNSGKWETLAVASGTDATYTFRFPLTERGMLRLRVQFPDGDRAVGTYDVR